MTLSFRRASCTIAVVVASALCCFYSRLAATIGYLYALLIALTVYDALLCIDLEAKHVWRSPKTSRKISRILYIYNRYLSILWNILTLGEIGTISDTVSVVF